MSFNTSNSHNECKNTDLDVIAKFRGMNYLEFARYVITSENHQAEIESFLKKSMHPREVNYVLETITEELWFNQDKLLKIRKGPLKMFYN